MAFENLLLPAMRERLEAVTQRDIMAHAWLSMVVNTPLPEDANSLIVLIEILQEEAFRLRNQLTNQNVLLH